MLGTYVNINLISYAFSFFDVSYAYCLISVYCIKYFLFGFKKNALQPLRVFQIGKFNIYHTSDSSRAE